jgi:hypothetical protein
VAENIRKIIKNKENEKVECNVETGNHYKNGAKPAKPESRERFH